MLVKHRTSAGIVGTRMTYATHPFDVVGWDGCLYPYTFNIDDYMPITGKVHQPPPVHQVFEGWNFVVCNFLPARSTTTSSRSRCPTTTPTSTATR